jgi:hypothetical protein
VRLLYTVTDKPRAKALHCRRMNEKSLLQLLYLLLVPSPLSFEPR